MKLPALFLGTIAALATAAGEPPPLGVPPEAPSVPNQIRIEMLVARIPEAQAVELQPLLRDPEKCGGAQERILAWIGKHQAELVDWPIITTRAGLSARTDNVHELHYATEFATPAVSLSKTDDGPILVQDPNAPADPGKAKPKAEGPLELRVLGVAPASFVKRDLGVMLEVEPVLLPDASTVEMRIVSHHITLLGWKKNTVENGQGAKAIVEQPEFQQLSTNVNITAQSGRPFLLGFHKLQDQKKIIEVSIVTATVLKPASAPKPEQTPRKKQR